MSEKSNSPSSEETISLNKFISDAGICSRREADQFIADGAVTINGKIGQAGNRVLATDAIKVNGKLLRGKPKSVYIAFNKPVGIVCTTDEREPNNIINYINRKERLFPIGRLDKDSSGLIFLTNDGNIVNKILRAGNRHEKEYHVTVHKTVTDKFLAGMSNGVPILGTRTRRCRVSKVNPYTFRITLIQGLNRQIRRMCEYFGYRVTKLIRLRIMNVSLGRMKIGQYRILSDNEIKSLTTQTAGSSKTQGSRPDKIVSNSTKRKPKTYKAKPTPDKKDPKKSKVKSKVKGSQNKKTPTQQDARSNSRKKKEEEKELRKTRLWEKPKAGSYKANRRKKR